MDGGIDGLIDEGIGGLMDGCGLMIAMALFLFELVLFL